MESIGETLRQARHAKGVTLEDASRATKVKIDILEKLEADDFAGLVSPTYTRGFIKLYADHLGLDGQAVASAYVDSQGGLRRRGLHVETVGTTRRTRELHLSVGGVVGVVAGLTVAVVIIALVVNWRGGGDETPAAVASGPATVVALPAADFDGYYQPPKKSEPLLLEVPR